MRRWMALAARLYPAKWRRRYGDEFDALLEDHDPGWRAFMDVLRGALRMQITHRAVYWKLAGGMAVAGAIAATAISFALPRVYTSTAVLRMTPAASAGAISPDARAAQAAHRMNELEQSVLSRTTLEGIITQPGLELYPKERAQEPLEDIVRRMRTESIRIRPANPREGPGGQPAFMVSFAYPDRRKAQAVVRTLTAHLIEENLQASRTQSQPWRSIRPQAAPSGSTLEVLDPASDPAKASSPGPAQFAAAGLALGLALGLLAALAMEWPRAILLVGGLGVGCGVLAIAISLALPDAYTSTAVLRFTPATAPTSLNGGAAGISATAKLQRLEERVTSRKTLLGMIDNPSFDLYRRQRARMPLEEIAGMMRRDIAIRPLNQSPSTFQISFSYPDRDKAQAVVRNLVAGLIDENLDEERDRAREAGGAKNMEIAQRGLGESLEVIDPPSDPQAPAYPNRRAITLAGFGLGIAFGAAAAYLRRQQRRSLRTA